MANVNVRIDETVKRNAELVFEKIGITPSAAINMFYIQVARTSGIPFELRADIPNETTMKAIEEVEEMEKDPKGQKTFFSVDEIMKK